MPEKKILYWMGCMSRLRTKRISDSTMEILRRLKVPFETLGNNEGCCGSVLLRTGQVKEAEVLALENVGKIKSGGYSEVVTSCPGCYRTILKEYPEVVGNMPFRVRHISQFLLDYEDGLRKNLKTMNVKVAYHDPCHLGRHMGVYDEPRRVILMVPGVELVEFKYNRGKALCCGSGGGVRSAYPALAIEVASSILDEPLKTTGARTIITACPFCNFNLNDAKHGDVEILDLPEFIMRAWRV